MSKVVVLVIMLLVMILSDRIFINWNGKDQRYSYLQNDLCHDSERPLEISIKTHFDQISRWMQSKPFEIIAKLFIFIVLIGLCIMVANYQLSNKYPEKQNQSLMYLKAITTEPVDTDQEVKKIEKKYLAYKKFLENNNSESLTYREYLAYREFLDYNKLEESPSYKKYLAYREFVEVNKQKKGLTYREYLKKKPIIQVDNEETIQVNSKRDTIKSQALKICKEKNQVQKVCQYLLSFLDQNYKGFTQ